MLLDLILIAFAQFCILALGGGLLYLFFEWKKQQYERLFQHEQAKKQSRRAAQSRPSQPQLRVLQRELITLVGGRVAAAERLVSRERARYPQSKPESFYWMKAIETLERKQKTKARRQSSRLQPSSQQTTSPIPFSADLHSSLSQGSRLTPTAPSSLPQPVNPATRETLRQLLNGDIKTAQRLVKSLQAHHPGRSEEWCYEKAISDLERDRYR